MKKTILALCLAIFPLMGLSETQRIDTVGGVLGIYKDPGQYGNAPVLFLGSIKNKILEDDRIQIDDRKKLGKDKELFLVSTNCNGSGCRVESHYLISELLGVAYTQIRNPDSNLSLLGRS